VDRLLTSGGARASIDGVEKLALMASNGDATMQIMAGGGVTIDAIPALARAGVDAVHLSARRRAGRVTETGPGGGSPSYDITDATTVARAVAAARRAAVAV
jgi:copper homeostasis protein